MRIILNIVLVAVLLSVAFLAIYKTGVTDGARQMARHILNPDYETESFYKIMGEECGSDKGWREMNDSLVFYKDGVTIDGKYLNPKEKEYFMSIK